MSARGLRSWGRLLRLSLMPSALADVAAGLVVGAGGRWPAGGAPFAMLLASLGVYHGALVLNDWADRADDAGTRPDRPLPSGDVESRTALGAALALLLGGVAAATAADPRAGAWMAGVALLAVLYDLRGRGPLLGPLLLGACRSANLAAGILYVRWSGELAELPSARTSLLPLLYGFYVFAVSRMARLEDGADEHALRERPRRMLLVAAAVLVTAPLWHPNSPSSAVGIAALVLSASAAVGLLREALARGEWSPARVGRATGMCLRRLLVFTSIAALMAHDGRHAAAWVAALVILAGYPLSWMLRRAFPPT